MREFLVAVFSALPREYESYAEQVKRGLIAGLVRRPSEKPNYLSVQYGEEVSEYEDPRGAYAELSGMTLLSKTHGPVSFGILLNEGVVMGMFSDVPLRPEDTMRETLDISGLRVRVFNGDHTDELRRLGIVDTRVDQVDEVIVDGLRLLRIRDLHDGDFLGVSDAGFFIVLVGHRQTCQIPEVHIEQLKASFPTMATSEIYACTDPQRG
ncbi:hypothetical protein [Propionicicella superfundia]|uniref:hypothetical protein n=1 Tax=Propionicicella superfundia TaxID=348582 RepID=UPI0012EBA08D|nr:hypothetical protein [Propionicicella superfundia]